MNMNDNGRADQNLEVSIDVIDAFSMCMHTMYQIQEKVYAFWVYKIETEPEFIL